MPNRRLGFKDFAFFNIILWKKKRNSMEVFKFTIT